jgi:hypothetical protein
MSMAQVLFAIPLGEAFDDTTLQTEEERNKALQKFASGEMYPESILPDDVVIAAEVTTPA